MEKTNEKGLLHETHLVLGMVLVAAAIAVIVLLPADKTAAPAADAVNSQSAAVVVPFTEIAHGMKSKVSERVNYLITTTEEFKKLWDLVDAKGAPPVIDFSKEVVIAVFAGAQPTTGYQISVAKVEDTTLRTVSITIAKPDEKCVTAQSVTTPYEIAAIPATSLPFAHEDILTTVDCAQ